MEYFRLKQWESDNFDPHNFGGEYSPSEAQPFNSQQEDSGEPEHTASENNRSEDESHLQEPVPQTDDPGFDLVSCSDAGVDREIEHYPPLPSLEGDNDLGAFKLETVCEQLPVPAEGTLAASFPAAEPAEDQSPRPDTPIEASELSSRDLWPSFLGQTAVCPMVVNPTDFDSVAVTTDRPREPQESPTSRPGRRSISRELSNGWKVYASTAECPGYGRLIHLGEAPYKGAKSGCNLLAIFQDLGPEPRTIYQMIINNGRPRLHFPGAVHWETDNHVRIPIPAGRTLEEICRQHPQHLSGSGLRPFLAEGWDEKRIWEHLPPKYRRNVAKIRPWNYIQALVKRELNCMHGEDHPGEEKPVPKSRKKRARGESEDVQSSADQTRASKVAKLEHNSGKHLPEEKRGGKRTRDEFERGQSSAGENLALKRARNIRDNSDDGSFQLEQHLIALQDAQSHHTSKRVRLTDSEPAEDLPGANFGTRTWEAPAHSGHTGYSGRNGTSALLDAGTQQNDLFPLPPSPLQNDASALPGTQGNALYLLPPPPQQKIPSQNPQDLQLAQADEENQESQSCMASETIYFSVESYNPPPQSLDLDDAAQVRISHPTRTEAERSASSSDQDVEGQAHQVSATPQGHLDASQAHSPTMQRRHNIPKPAARRRAQAPAAIDYFSPNTTPGYSMPGYMRPMGQQYPPVTAANPLSISAAHTQTALGYHHMGNTMAAENAWTPPYNSYPPLVSWSAEQYYHHHQHNNNTLPLAATGRVHRAQAYNAFGLPENMDAMNPYMSAPSHNFQPQPFPALPTLPTTGVQNQHVNNHGQATPGYTSWDLAPQMDGGHLVAAQTAFPAMAGHVQHMSPHQQDIFSNGSCDVTPEIEHNNLGAQAAFPTTQPQAQHMSFGEDDLFSAFNWDMAFQTEQADNISMGGAFPTSQSHAQQRNSYHTATPGLENEVAEPELLHSGAVAAQETVTSGLMDGHIPSWMVQNGTAGTGTRSSRLQRHAQHTSPEEMADSNDQVLDGNVEPTEAHPVQPLEEATTTLFEPGQDQDIHPFAFLEQFTPGEPFDCLPPSEPEEPQQSSEQLLPLPKNRKRGSQQGTGNAAKRSKEAQGAHDISPSSDARQQRLEQPQEAVATGEGPETAPGAATPDPVVSNFVPPIAAAPVVSPINIAQARRAQEVESNWKDTPPQYRPGVPGFDWTWENVKRFYTVAEINLALQNAGAVMPETKTWPELDVLRKTYTLGTELWSRLQDRIRENAMDKSEKQAAKRRAKREQQRTGRARTVTSSTTPESSGSGGSPHGATTT